MWRDAGCSPLSSAPVGTRGTLPGKRVRWIHGANYGMARSRLTGREGGAGGEDRVWGVCGGERRCGWVLHEARRVWELGERVAARWTTGDDGWGGRRIESRTPTYLGGGEREVVMRMLQAPKLEASSLSLLI